jgi:hypothetical protein
MAQRFGGKFSPQSGDYEASDRVLNDKSKPLPPAAPRHPLEGRPFWVLLCASPILLSAFGEGPVTLARSLIGFGLIAGAEMLTREGLRAEAAFNARRIARRPAFPRKISGALVFGAGLGLSATDPEMGLFGAITVGVVAGALHLLAFGMDPMRDKGMEGIDTFQQDRVARVVAEGEKHLAAMKDAILRAKDRRLEARVELFAAHARELFRVVEEDPGDLAAARRYMGIYLEGARDATIKFADFWPQTRDESARTAYESLLDDLEKNFTARTKSLIADGREGLDVEIEVLRDRLAREGVALTAPQG